MCQVIRKPSIVVTEVVSNETFLSHYGKKLKTAPKTISKVPAGQTAVMLMDNFDDIHVAAEEFELEHLTQYSGVWYLIPNVELQRVL
jgi:hypothetical protein